MSLGLLLELGKYGLAAAAGGAYMVYAHPRVKAAVAWLDSKLNS